VSKTGFPAKKSRLRATVVCDVAMTADAWDTAFMVLGLEKSIELLKKLPGIEVYFIYSNPQGEYEVFYSEGMKRMIMDVK